MLIRYCAGHPRYFGYPRLLGVRWTGWVVSTAGGLCEACRERERGRWEADPYGAVLIPVPVELGPRTLGRRVLGAIIAAAAAAMVATAALLMVSPPDLIPSGGEPELFSSGARLAGPDQAQVETETERPAASRTQRTSHAAPRVMASRVALTGRHTTHKAPEQVAFARGCAAGVAFTPAPARYSRPVVTAQSP
jgi:hypothetical protein